MAQRVEKRIHLVVSGRVQGVFFRSFTRKAASELGITGWARNTPDDAVEIVAEGSEQTLKKFIEKLKQGPPAARVDNIQVKWSPAKNEFKTFEITY